MKEGGNSLMQDPRETRNDGQPFSDNNRPHNGAILWLLPLLFILVGCSSLRVSELESRVDLGPVSYIERRSDGVIIYYHPSISEIGGGPIKLKFYCPSSILEESPEPFESVVTLISAAAGCLVALSL